VVATAETQLWVCTDCIMVLANGSDGVSYLAEDDAAEFWARFSAGVEREAPDSGMGIVPGACSHSPACALEEPGDDEEPECSCSVIDFSRMTCDVCGTGLAGERHAATVLRP
jgi:hypothetical protein